MWEYRHDSGNAQHASEYISSATSPQALQRRAHFASSILRGCNGGGGGGKHAPTQLASNQKVLAGRLGVSQSQRVAGWPARAEPQATFSDDNH